ncbi:ribonuclease BN [Paraburkholderia phenoliruptrix BR3459a]|uniref:Ribonuclease BN n=2 Tax=Paraburkholderia phenoliruptrix TaxID=252970 RepID=K0DY95_9BURK|nr:ribonuclease BN [Paraburkholderia phenoliruptrix BR3459a]
MPRRVITFNDEAFMNKVSSPAAARRKHGRLRNALRVVVNAGKRFMSDRCPMMAASVGFYSAFSLAPTLLMVLAVAGWFFGEDAARGRLFEQVRGILGKDAAEAMQTIVEHAHRASGGGIAAAVSLVLLIVGASATFTSLNTALDVVLEAEKNVKSKSSLTWLVRTRLVSVGMVLGLGFLLVVSLVLDTAITYAGHALFGDSPLVIVTAVLQTVLGLIVLGAAFTALLRWMSDARVSLAHAAVGGMTAAILFSVGRHLFGLYLTHAGTASSFGAAGSLAVLMMWLYFSAAVFLFGAETTAELAGRNEVKDKEKDRPLSVGAARSRG